MSSHIALTAPCITGDTIDDMPDVTIRDLRNKGGEVVDRALRGEEITITRDGRPVAELRSLRPALGAEALLERWGNLPTVDPAALRADLDEFLDVEL
jgi:prevent-host-death family protein